MNPLVKTLLQGASKKRRNSARKNSFLEDDEASDVIRKWNSKMMEKFGGFEINADIGKSEDKILVRFFPVPTTKKDGIQLSVSRAQKSNKYTHEIQLKIDWNEMPDEIFDEEYEVIQKNIPKPKTDTFEKIVGLNLSKYNVELQDATSTLRDDGSMTVEIPIFDEANKENKTKKLI